MIDKNPCLLVLHLNEVFFCRMPPRRSTRSGGSGGDEGQESSNTMRMIQGLIDALVVTITARSQGESLGAGNSECIASFQQFWKMHPPTLLVECT